MVKRLLKGQMQNRYVVQETVASARYKRVVKTFFFFQLQLVQLVTALEITDLETRFTFGSVLADKQAICYRPR